jgi:recombination protein RecA
MYNEGISKEADVLDLAVKDAFVEKSGAWYEYNGAKIGQGREAAKQYLRDNPKVREELDKKIREKYFPAK